MLADFRGKKVYLTGDETTLPLDGRLYAARLAQAAARWRNTCSNIQRESTFHPKETSGSSAHLQIHMPADTGLIVAGVPAQ
jgi:hypothetical protein